MTYTVGDKVRSLSDPSRVGVVEALGSRYAGEQFYHVFWGGSLGTKTVGEGDLAAHVQIDSPLDALRNGALGGYADFQRLVTLQRLVRDQPLRNNLYAFNASRTRFFPYQFKPLLKFLESSRHRLLICDEVGLGKTIEAGLILLELKARQTLRLVLIVCPSNLKAKWKLELRQRFGEEFRELSAPELRTFLDDYEESPDRVSLNGIISLETVRTESVRDRLRDLAVPFDLVVFDEAHHLRNFGTSQREAASLLTDAAAAVIMLTATPVHLGEENLFSLLNLLDDEDFPDQESALERFDDNQAIVRAQAALALADPDFDAVSSALGEAEHSGWLAKRSAMSAMREKIERAAAAFRSGGLERRVLLDLKRDLADLNLLGHILTRTRKRDVHEHVAVRRARAIEVEFTERERQLYDAVSEEVRRQSENTGDNSGMLRWRLNTPQRRIASSVHGMVEHYRQHSRAAASDDEDGGLLDDSSDHRTAAAFGPEVTRLLADWPDDAADGKFDALLDLLCEVKPGGRADKILVFASFRPTIRYLARRLNAAGIRTVWITGETPVEERPKAIREFRDDPAVRVLISSRVGSEGLDFQFCSTVVNYDLPWNPMEVEQRIGRLDRIGQEAETILIVNFWTPGTIEERILRRLYDRIGIFERSIGDLEVILGDVASDIQRQLIMASLRPEEAAAAAERTARVVVAKRQEIETLEASAARFVGVDDFFDEEIDAIRARRRYVTGGQLFRFVLDFLRADCPRTRLAYDSEQRSGQLVPDEALRQFLQRTGRAGDAFAIAGSVGGSIPVTFDSQTAFNKPGVEFLSVVHPLVTAIAEEYQQRGPGPRAQHVALRTQKLSPGFYFFFIYRIQVSAARSFGTLESVFIGEEFLSVCDSLDSEALLGEMVECGEEPPARIELGPAAVDQAATVAEEALLERLAQIRSIEEVANDAFVRQRMASLESYYTKSIAKKRDLLVRAVAAQRQERYLRMLRGQLTRLEGELHAKQADLERRRHVGTEHDIVSAGILEVVG